MSQRRRFPLFDRNRNCAKCGCDKPAAFEYCPGLSEGQWDKKCGQLAATENGKRARHDYYSSFLNAASTSRRSELDPEGVYRDEHIHRSCPDCGFVWIEETLDKGHPLEQLGAAAK